MERNTQTPKHRVGGLPPRYSTYLLDQALDPNPSTNKKQNFQRTTTKRKPHKTSLLMTPLKEHLTMYMWGNTSHTVARSVPRSSSKFKSSLWMKEKERKPQPRLSVWGGCEMCELMNPVFNKRLLHPGKAWKNVTQFLLWWEEWVYSLAV